MKSSIFSRAALLAVGTLFGATVQAARIVEVTADGNSYTDSDFWSVSFTTSGSETVSLSSIRIDLSTLSPDAFFDFDGIFSLACPALSCVPDSPPFLADRSGEGPIFNSGVGVAIGEVNFNYDPLTDPERPTSLDLTFTNFVSGDSFTFGADTDGAPDGGSDDDLSFNTGDELAGAQLTAFFSDGSEASAFFVNSCGASCSTAVIPVPAAVWLFGSGLFGLAAVARRRR